MIIDGKTAKSLGNLSASDRIEIDGRLFTVLSTEMLSPHTEGIHPGGFRFILSEPGATKEFELEVTDSVISIKLEGVLKGPAPLNSNPNLMYVQDGEMTRKYRITHEAKSPIIAEFFEEGKAAGIRSLKVISRK